MKSFISDYSVGAHPQVMMRLLETNMEHYDGYGNDPYCEHAREMIQEMIGKPEAEVQFLTGGTPTNVTTIAASLRPYEGVVCARSGHIYRHETGAVEASGHKLFPYVRDDGKLTPEDIESAWVEYEDEHTVVPAMAYISQPTELGTIYSKAELEALRACCDAHDMILYLDGARLACALTADTADATLQDIANLTDVFYIGGTKCGLLMGEAVVINEPKIADHYRWMMKQNNAMLAKGRLLGVQFEALLAEPAVDPEVTEGETPDRLLYEIGRHENRMAGLLTEALKEAGFSFRWEPATNQIFPILPNDLVEKLHEEYLFLDWEKADDTHTVVRFVTGWSTTEEEISDLLKSIEAFQAE